MDTLLYLKTCELFENRREGYTTDVIDVAARQGNDDIVAYLLTKGFAVTPTLQHVFRRQNMEKLERTHILTRELTFAAIRHGYLDAVKLHILELLIQKNTVTTDADKIIVAAANGGHLEIVEYIFEAASLEGCQMALSCACTNSHFCVTEYLLIRRIKLPNYRMYRQAIVDLLKQHDAILY